MQMFCVGGAGMQLEYECHVSCVAQIYIGI